MKPYFTFNSNNVLNRALKKKITMTAKEMAEALVFHEAEKPFTIEKVSLPTPRSNEVLVRIAYTTICTSDLHTYYGRRTSPCPSILGHEIIGRVVSLGSAINTDYKGEALQVGNLITWSVYAHDVHGTMAKKGFPQKSQNLFKYGHQRLASDKPLSGGFATHCLLREGTAIFNLSDRLNYKELAPLNCTHATIAGAIRLAGDLNNKNVLVTGVGMLGLSACAMAKESGANSVYAMDRDIDRLNVAKTFGVNQTIEAHLEVNDITEQLGANQGIDVVIDTTGVPSVMEKGLSLLSIGGMAVWVGAVYSQRATQVNAEMIVRNLLTIKGLHNYRPQDLAVAIAFLEENHKKYPFETLVNKDYLLNELGIAFNEAPKGGHYRIGIRQDQS